MFRPVTLAFARHGKPPFASQKPLLILPGLFGSKQNWSAISKSLSAKLSRPIVALDLRNHGDSPHSSVHSYEAMASDVEALVAAQGWSAVDLMGHSMGGKVVMYLALQNHGWLDKTCVVDMAPVESLTGSRLFASYVKVMESVTANGPVSGQKEADHILSQVIPEVAIRQFLLTNLKRNPALTQGNAYEWRINLDALGTNLSRLWSFPFAPRSASHKGPVLFIAGGKSNYITPDMWPVIQGFFPDARLVTFPDAGHWVHSEKPADFVQETAAFFKE
ncbi:Alpha/beta hydrolase domain-containing protein 11 [Kappamyces sp. JEL0680]|nr:Alpha/beta hydrolase domain-containing protein 11 [Kappamyces sp. JEL0680]